MEKLGISLTIIGALVTLISAFIVLISELELGRTGMILTGTISGCGVVLIFVGGILITVNYFKNHS